MTVSRMVTATGTNIRDKSEAVMCEGIGIQMIDTQTNFAVCKLCVSESGCHRPPLLVDDVGDGKAVSWSLAKTVRTRS